MSVFPPKSSRSGLPRRFSSSCAQAAKLMSQPISERLLEGSGEAGDRNVVDAVADELPATGPTRTRRPIAVVYLGFCLVLVGLNLRTIFSSFSVVLPEITSHAAPPGWAGVVLTTVPVTLLGLSAPLAPLLARKFGAERVLLGALILLTSGLLLRPAELAVPIQGALWAGHTSMLIVGTAVCGVAVALCNVLLPGLIRRDFPHHLGLVGGFHGPP